MIELLFGVLGVAAGLGAALVISRKTGKNATPSRPPSPSLRAEWIDPDIATREIDEITRLTAHEIIARTASTGRDAEEMLDKLWPSLQEQAYETLREISNLEVTDPKDRVIMRAGYLQALFALYDGLQDKAVRGRMAKQEIDRIQSESIGVGTRA